MAEEPTDDPFHVCELGSEAILGARTFEDVLFTDELFAGVDNQLHWC